MISTPLLGSLSDRIGRKKILLLSHLGNVLGYALSSFAVITQQLSYLFLGHLISGLLGANMTMTNALISDGDCPIKKRRLFSLTHLIIALTFVISPLISRKLFLLFADIDRVAVYTFYTAMSLSFCNFILLSLFLNALPFTEHRFTFKTLISFKPVKHLLLGSFCYYFAWYGFIKFFQAY